MKIKLVLLSLIILALISCEKEEVKETVLKPEVSFNVEQETPGSNSIIIKNTTTGSVTTYTWNYGDGKEETNASTNFHYTYQAIGEYTIMLTASNEAGSTKATKKINVTNLNNSNIEEVAKMSEASDIGYVSLKANFKVGTSYGHFQIATTESFSDYSESNPGDLLTSSTIDKEVQNLRPNQIYYMRIKNKDNSFSNIVSATTKDVGTLAPTVTISELTDTKKIRANATTNLTGETAQTETYTYELAYDNQFSNLITTLNTTTSEFGGGSAYLKVPGTKYYIRAKGTINGVETNYSATKDYTATDKIYSGLGNLNNKVTANQTNTLIIIGSNISSDYLEINLTSSPSAVGEEFIFVPASTSSTDNYILRYKDNVVNTLYVREGELKLKILEIKDGKISAIILNGNDDSPYLGWNKTSGFLSLLFTTK